jgi:hypothetical protein
MGLTPLEGLIGGTRCGTIDPTAVFHLLKDPGADGGADGMKVSKAEMTLNKYVPTRMRVLISENPVFRRWQEPQTSDSSPPVYQTPHHVPKKNMNPLNSPTKST